MSKSKNVYQGLNVQRIHRSELDDAKLRDLAREDARLNENLKTVERARHVMLKSMDADKQLFIKSGTQANNKSNKSSNHGFNQKSQSKLANDQKLRRPSSAEERDPSTNELIQNHVAERQRPRVPDVTSYYDAGSVYDHLDHLFEANAALESGKRASKGSLQLHSGEGQLVSHNGLDIAFVEESVSVLPTAESVARSSVTVNEKVGENEFIPYREEETRKSNVWDVLSTPKHISITKAKRAQVEREFTRPAKSSPTGASSKGKADLPKRQVTAKKTSGQPLTRRS
nr:hypothetical protein BgiMline_029548 [Biomphalaria glabrata]